MKHKHAEVFEAAARGEADEFEVSAISWNDPFDWRPAANYLDVIYNTPDIWSSRRKQKTHVVNGFTVPEPLTVKPNRGEHFFTENAGVEDFNSELTWLDIKFDNLLFRRGVAYATKEGAIANCKARLGLDPYKDES